MERRKTDYFVEIEKLISISPKQVYIAFAIHCARDVIGNITDEKINKQVSDALLVVERFNRGFATQLEVEAAHSAAHAAISAAISAAKEIKMKEYYEVLVKMLESISLLEKIVYNITQEIL